jgi:hypothetical protein
VLPRWIISDSQRSNGGGSRAGELACLDQWWLCPQETLGNVCRHLSQLGDSLAGGAWDAANIPQTLGSPTKQSPGLKGNSAETEKTQLTSSTFSSNKLAFPQSVR